MGTVHWTTPLQRRALGMLLVGTMVLAACGDDDDATTATTTGTSAATTAGVTTTAGGGGATTATTKAATSTTSAAAGEPADLDHDGELKLFTDMTQFGTGFDPPRANAPGQWWNELVYGTLLRRTGDGVYHDQLAKLSGTRIVDPATIEVELYPNLKYTDGTPLTAQSVVDAVARNIAVLAGGGRQMRSAELSQVDTVTATSPTKVTFKLKQPIAGAFYDLLAHEETMPYKAPPVDDKTTLMANPIGAGPYLVEPGSINVDTGFTLVKNPDYVDAASIRVPTVEVASVGTAALVNALNTDVVDFADSSFDVAQQVQASGFEPIIIPSQDAMGFLWIACMTDRTPALADPNVRRALNHATDKRALIAATLVGVTDQTVVMDQLWQNSSKYADPDLKDSYPFDTVRAKQLLADAGYGDGLDLTFTVGAVTLNTTRTAEVLQQQWAAVGVNLTLQASTNLTTDFYTERKYDLYGSTQGVNRNWTDKLTRNWAPGSVGNTCDPSLPQYGGDPNFTNILLELRGLSRDDPRAVELWQQAAVHHRRRRLRRVHGPRSVHRHRQHRQAGRGRRRAEHRQRGVLAHPGRQPVARPPPALRQELTHAQWWSARARLTVMADRAEHHVGALGGRGRELRPTATNSSCNQSTPIPW